MINYAPRPGRQIYVRNDELIAKVREWIQEDQCFTLRMMAGESVVNRETIHNILAQDFGKGKKH